MAAPHISGTGINLKKNGKSTFWLVGKGLDNCTGNDCVVIETTKGTWKGKIKEGPNPTGHPDYKKVLIKVEKEDDDDAPGSSDDDLVALEITITNDSNETSNTVIDIGILDGPE